MTKLKTIKAVYERAPEYQTAGHQQRFTSSAQIFEALKNMEDLTEEYFIAYHLDSKNRVVCFSHVSTGSLNAAIVHPREVFKTALLSNAAAIIFAHNHPSGDPTPSREDIELTERLVKAGDLLGIRVLDHIIIGEGRYVSLADQGTI